MPGKPNHLQSNVDKCVAMKWYSDFSYHGNFKVGEWENKPYTQKHAWVCSHEQTPDMVKNNSIKPKNFSNPKKNFKAKRIFILNIF